MRVAYLLLIYLITPLMFVFWFVRGLRNPSYLERLGQRFGVGFPRLDRPSLWVHAVSVGEVQAAVPLIRALLARFPNRPLIVTTVTPTGASRVQAIFGDSVTHAYAPFETYGAVKRFFDSVRPELAIILETEIWPNLYHECGRRGVPLVLASARISPRSVRRYRRLVPLFREALSHGIVIAAQSEADADRFRELGAAPERTFVTGNIKFDVELSDELPADGNRLRRELGAGRPVWVAASTHASEEKLVLESHALVRERHADALLLLVPRHPERFDDVVRMVDDAGFGFVRRTAAVAPTAATAVFVGDTLGELTLFYAAADIAVVCGSFAPVGGHNLLEPAALGVPVVTGPHLFNALDIADKFRESDASLIVDDSRQLADALLRLFADEAARHELGRRGRELVEGNRGALEQLLRLVEPLIGGDSSIPKRA
ncbi:MAG: lipid IV(A) 3-deoxy-D-manno-octulosonic acid transferase, partial [Pseudomonadota bacterium]